MVKRQGRKAARKTAGQKAAVVTGGARGIGAAIAAGARRFGRLDALVNNAGLADPADPPVHQLALAAWNRRLGVIITGQNFVADGGMTKKMIYAE